MTYPEKVVQVSHHEQDLWSEKKIYGVKDSSMRRNWVGYYNQQRTARETILTSPCK